MEVNARILYESTYLFLEVTVFVTVFFSHEMLALFISIEQGESVLTNN